MTAIAKENKERITIQHNTYHPMKHATIGHRWAKILKRKNRDNMRKMQIIIFQKSVEKNSELMMLGHSKWKRFSLLTIFEVNF